MIKRLMGFILINYVTCGLRHVNRGESEIKMKYLATIPIIMALINIPFINWSVNWWNPMSFGICLGIGIVTFLYGTWD